MSLVALSVLVDFSSCATKDKSGSKSEIDNLAADDGEGDEDKPDDATSNGASTEPGSGDVGQMPHPSKATAWQTRALLFTTPQPKAEDLFRCIDQVTRIGKQAGNQYEMMTLAPQISALAAPQLRTYHFCFYQMVMRLDEKLTKGGPMLTEMAPTFLSSMKTLWIFARGMDTLDGKTRYFDYLYKRYIDMSKQHFGRDLERLGPPMGNFNPETAAPSSISAKPAGPAPIP